MTVIIDLIPPMACVEHHGQEMTCHDEVCKADIARHKGAHHFYYCCAARNAFGVPLLAVGKEDWKRFHAAMQLYYSIRVYEELDVDEIVYEESREIERRILTIEKKKKFNAEQKNRALDLLEILSPEFAAYQRKLNNSYAKNTGAS